jgi:hypothetical protein
MTDRSQETGLRYDLRNAAGVGAAAPGETAPQ